MTIEQLVNITLCVIVNVHLKNFAIAIYLYAYKSSKLIMRNFLWEQDSPFHSNNLSNLSTN